MTLLPKWIAATLPPLYAQEDLGEEAIVHVKFFTPDSSWTWLASEFDPEKRIFFGLIHGHEEELGYFSLDELEQARGLLGLPIERDEHWRPKTIRECRSE